MSTSYGIGASMGVTTLARLCEGVHSNADPLHARLASNSFLRSTVTLVLATAAFHPPFPCSSASASPLWAPSQC